MNKTIAIITFILFVNPYAQAQYSSAYLYGQYTAAVPSEDIGSIDNILNDNNKKKYQSKDEELNGQMSKTSDNKMEKSEKGKRKPASYDASRPDDMMRHINPPLYDRKYK